MILTSTDDTVDSATNARNANTATGSQIVMAPLASLPNTASVPRSVCQISVVRP
ncbi:MAG: hypothetical protein ABIQ59_13430 [Nocardioidaceae bacterium]